MWDSGSPEGDWPAGEALPAHLGDNMCFYIFSSVNTNFTDRNIEIWRANSCLKIFFLDKMFAFIFPVAT